MTTSIGQMKVLLIETSLGLGYELEDRLTAAGHDVLTCYDRSGAPCKGVAIREECPLESGPEVAVLVRPDCAQPTLHEAGILCARRHHLPVVRAGSADALDQLGRPGEIESAAAQATRCVARGYATVAEAAVADVDGLATIERSPRRLAVTIHVPFREGESMDRGRIADRARAAVRKYDPAVPVIDVAVVVTGTP